MSYDLIIVGAGIAGLYTGLNYIKQFPKHKVIILEKYDYVGGRIVTYRKPQLQWEIGAGRIASDHYMVKKLMKQYGLTWIDIPNTSTWLSGKSDKPNPFENLIPTLLAPLASLPKSILATNTLADLLREIHGSKINTFIQQFPYYCELHTLRADLALLSFSITGEMGPKASFGVCTEGLDSIITHMANEFIKLGGIIQIKSPVNNVIDKSVILENGTKLTGKNIVLALHAKALQQIPSLKSWEPLKHLSMEPLVRMYAVFPTSSDTWFHNMDKIVTNSKIRYIIPIDEKKGTVMISYTDGKDAKLWINLQNKKGNEAVKEEVMKEVRKLFPTISIPDPLLFKIHPWTEGCTYWLGGKYNPIEMSEKAHTIRNGVYCCGESISLRQAWMEGALESAEKVIKILCK